MTAVEVDLPDGDRSLDSYVVLDESDAETGDWVDDLVGETVVWSGDEWEVTSVTKSEVKIERTFAGQFPWPPIKHFDREPFAEAVMRGEANR